MSCSALLRIGFTVVELLLALAIMATIIGLAVPPVSAARLRALNERAAYEIRLLETELEQYDQEYGEFPASLGEIGRASMVDPWGRGYEYNNYEKPGGPVRKDRFLVPINSDYDLFSVGADGKSSAPLTATSSRDDIIRANDGAFIGLAADF